jgi:hypothetical protein
MFLRRIPIRKIDFSNDWENSMHDKIAENVARVVKLNKSLSSINLSTERSVILDEIQQLTNDIDNLVYKIYNVEKSYIKLIENY